MRALYALFSVAFMLWGGGFGLLALSEFLRSATSSSIGVGTSSAVNMTLLMWIGGMFFFGVGALLMRPLPTSLTADAALSASALSSDWHSDPSLPRDGDHSNAGVAERATYRSVDYRLHGDGIVTAHINGRVVSWRNQAAFKAWADGGADK